VTSAVLGLSWASLAAAALLRLRPVRARRPMPTTTKTVPRTRMAALGRAVLRRCGRPDPAPLLAERVGLAMTAALALLAVRPIAALPAAAVGWAVPGIRVRRAQRSRQAAIDASLA
jgi:hypothetical protein